MLLLLPSNSSFSILLQCSRGVDEHSTASKVYTVKQHQTSLGFRASTCIRTLLRARPVRADYHVDRRAVPHSSKREASCHGNVKNILKTFLVEFSFSLSLPSLHLSTRFVDNASEESAPKSKQPNAQFTQLKKSPAYIMLHKTSNIEAWIEVSDNEGVSWSEPDCYKVRQDDHNAMCYIEAKEGQRFRYHVKSSKPLEDLTDTAVQYYFDGTKAVSHLVSSTRLQEGSTCETLPISNNGQRPLVFQKV
jgi:hypothetical protein